ncbi:MAG: helix-turn-helix domain-containing protein [Labilibaculum antarcticum]
MPAEIITTDDLREFKIELLNEFKAILKQQNGLPNKKWLKSHEVQDLLGVSPGTLRSMRITGGLNHTKVGRVIFYDLENIKKMLEKNQVQNGFRLRSH